MTPKKRGADTACAVPGLPNAHGLHDFHCERVVLAGLMREPVATVAALRDLKFVTGDLYHDPHQRLYDVLRYLAHGGAEGPLLADCYREISGRGGWLDNSFANHSACFDRLVDVWGTHMWFEDILKWADARETGLPFNTWAAKAAAYKVKHLTTRRHMIHAAAEVIRDALSPPGGIEQLGKRITDFDEDY